MSNNDYHHYQDAQITFSLPPTQPPEDIRTHFVKNENFITGLQPPQWTYAEVNINAVQFFLPAKKQGERPQRVENVVIRRILRDPKFAPKHLSTLLMGWPITAPGVEPQTLVPAHLPDFSDLEPMKNRIPTMLNWFLRRYPRMVSPNVVIPSELSMMCDPVPVLDPLRDIYLLTSQHTSLRMESWSNAVKITRTAFQWEQVFITAGWRDKMRAASRTIFVQWECQDRDLYSPKLGHKITIDEMDFWEAREDLLSTPAVPKFMTSLSWNCRGLARPTFKHNFLHLIDAHHPDLVFLFELRVGKEHCMEIFEGMPFDSYDLVETEGFAGGLVVLWNSTNVKFTTISKSSQSIHGVVQGTEATNWRVSAAVPGEAAQQADRFLSEEWP